LINLLRVAAFAFILSFGLNTFAKISVSSKTLKEASHFELGSLKNWTYEVSRSQKGNGLVVSVQFKGVSADEIQSLENFRDKRVSQVIVKEGLNKEALVEFYIENGLNFFDYQTEGQVFGQGAGGQILVFDVYTETKPKVAQKPIDSLVKKNINSFVQNKKENKNAVRGIASVDKPTLGQQPALLSSDKNTKEEQKYNVIDVVDKDYKRFAFEGNTNTHEAIVRSEEQIYPPFPELVRGIYPQLSDLESNKLNFEVEPTKDTENQTVRLIIKLFKEEKYLLSLKTQKFFREKGIRWFRIR
jgi:hypothetical protein